MLVSLNVHQMKFLDDLGRRQDERRNGAPRRGPLQAAGRRNLRRLAELGTSADGVTLGSMAGRLEFGGVMWYPQNIWVNGLKQLEHHHETHR